ncbi:MAG: iron-containing alcohol dehydrogenase [Cyclobacteriaceae bacterium]|nr:iron-containing alcohol dehydrogenase [Cyclobacteriaceae bacterium]
MMNFSFTSTPDIHFGAGKIKSLPGLVSPFGKKTFLLTGRKSFRSGIYYQQLLDALSEQGLQLRISAVEGEPTPQSVDVLRDENAGFNPDVVIAIGGGSVIDAGKALSAMLTVHGSIRDYLEGVGDRVHPGTKIPFIAVPTTAGTGSECTKNAVISETGSSGFKKSLRHRNFVPDIALIDPRLTFDCPPFITATSGMDAFTQLLEPYLSNIANPFTDSLAVAGLEQVSMHLKRSYHQADELRARSGMSMAACLSGICLANAGLGLVHGFASSIGGLFPVAHGLICSVMMYPVNKITVDKLRSSLSSSNALSKYARVGEIFAGDCGKSDDWYIDFLMETIHSLHHELQIPHLSDFNISENDFDAIVAKTANRNHPVNMEKEELIQILEKAL